MKTKKIFIIAGEPSGDVLGGKIMAAIKAENPAVEFVGIGGKNMQEQGLDSLFDIAELSIMGFLEVLPHIPKLLKRINQTAQNIIDSKADLVLTIDSPDFCFRVIKKIKNHAIKKAHLIAPSVWAYREKRAQKVAKLYDLLLAILPFEPPYFEKYGLKTVFIGHPIVEGHYTVTTKQLLEFQQKQQIKEDDLIICATAGSRIGEVKRILPEIIKAANILAEKYSNLKILLPVIAKTKNLVEEHLNQFNCPVQIVEEDNKYLAFKSARLAIAKSGTNNLEIAIYQLPLITIYKINPLTHFLIKMMVKIKFANLINLILNRAVIPELLQNDCTGEKISQTANHLIANPKIAQNQIDEAKNVLKMLGLNAKIKPSKKAALEIVSQL